MAIILGKPTAADLYLLQHCCEPKRFSNRKTPSFILNNFEYKAGYYVIVDRTLQPDAVTGNPVVKYVYYPTRLSGERAGRRYLDRPCPVFVQECYVMLKASQIFKISGFEASRGILKANTLLSNRSNVDEVVYGINELYGTTPAEHSIEEQAAKGDASQAPANTSVPNLEQIDVLQYTSNPQTFWAI